MESDEGSRCPRCGSKKVARILYGYPMMTPEFRRDLDSGKVVLGGCIVSDTDSQWQCRECDAEWPAP